VLYDVSEMPRLGSCCAEMGTQNLTKVWKTGKTIYHYYPKIVNFIPNDKNAQNVL
jgi:hypothetical protein